MNEPQIVYNDDISLRDYILKGRDYLSEVIRYWYIPAAFALLVIAYQLYKHSKFVPEYPAIVTFSVDEDEGGSSSGLSGMLSQFGLGGVRPARYNFDKILELSQSRRVVQDALFDKTTIDGKEDFLANHVIRIYDMKFFEDQESFYFSHDSIDGFDRRENEVLVTLYNMVIGPPEQAELALMTADYNEDSNIMSLTASTIHETLSIELAIRGFRSLSDYYITKAIEKSLKTYEIVTTKRDSILGVLRSTEYRLANFKDSNRNILMRTDQVGELRLHRDVSALNAMYAEVLKNTEIADFSLRNKTPFIQVIDAPIAPIFPTQSSLLRKIIIGLILGGGLGVVIVSARKAYRDIMQKSS